MIGKMKAWVQKKLSRTPVGVELAITAAHWLALGFTAVHRTLCPEQIFSTIFSIFLVFIDQYQHLPVKLVQTEWGRNLVHMLAWSTIIINRFLTKYVVFVEVVECYTCYRSFCASSGTRCCTICHQNHNWIKSSFSFLLNNQIQWSPWKTMKDDYDPQKEEAPHLILLIRKHLSLQCFVVWQWRLSALTTS